MYLTSEQIDSLADLAGATGRGLIDVSKSSHGGALAIEARIGATQTVVLIAADGYAHQPCRRTPDGRLVLESSINERGEHESWDALRSQMTNGR